MDDETEAFVEYWLVELADVIEGAVERAYLRARLDALDTDRRPDA